MRTAATVGVLDVGCFSARLLAAERGGSLVDPLFSHKVRLRLDRELDPSGRLGRDGVDAICAAVAEIDAQARAHGVAEVFPLATSSIRDARNAAEVVQQVRRTTGVELRFLSGKREAELSYLAARRWFGASAGPLAVLDIGGGTVELAAGRGERASFARSLRLGAREMTRLWLDTDVPSEQRVSALREHALDRVRRALAETEPQLRGFRTVGCSKVLRQLARLAGSRPHRDGAARDLYVEDLREWIPRLATLPASRRADLPGISRPRARQALAGAVVAEALLTVFGGSAVICPWSTTQGLLLSLLDAPEPSAAARSVA
ncbi:Ppx/GppA phosphatase family protein [Prauserella muralis]|uniref:Exopolyphosphatase n=1 Tax=Prauserella muralis TaxID=588067 RepID=A0A2V4AIH2_9PSEU|nr:exopolyphosphatase [Prauserella muralis]PXY19742.1 exopolyphosphatase [Prauserella muralis]TWE29484.1 exopolyphosphatase/guanosine-5'-triphosphate,3'-diphosphate pyrophosphatase [Prauserella muralis]